MSKRSRKAVEALANEKYIFPAFNILIYAENYIYPQASASAEGDSPTIVESNRELIYNLYYKALKLEPEPKHPELTFSQRQLMNRARKFVTMKMKKRMEMRANKKTMKDKRNMRKMLSDQIMNQLRQQFQEQGMIEAEGDPADPTKLVFKAKEVEAVEERPEGLAADTGNHQSGEAEKSQKVVKKISEQ